MSSAELTSALDHTDHQPTSIQSLCLLPSISVSKVNLAAIEYTQTNFIQTTLKIGMH